MPYQFHAFTDVGRVRQNNEDAVFYDAALGLALLADGMGGYNAGEVASGMAIACIRDDFRQWRAEVGSDPSSRESQRAMERCAARANAAIVEAGRAQPACRGMGTTLVFCVFGQNEVLVGHMGDSRVYRWRGGQLVRITRDHSVLQERIDAGLIDARDASAAPYRNLVTRALGVEPAGALEVHAHPVEPDDLYLLCSDGLSDMLEENTIAALLATGLPMSGVAQALVGAANGAGGRDNVSVVLVQADGVARKRAPLIRWLGV